MPPHEAAQAAMDIPNTEVVELARLLDRVRECSERGMRFITATCVDLGDRFELNYHFDADLQALHLRTFVPRKEPVPSISGIYLAAFLIENEMKELFGVDITGIAIDYHGRLYLTDDSAPTPMARNGSGAATAAVTEA